MVKVDFRGPLTANETEQSVDAAVRGIGSAYCLERRVKAEIASGALEVVMADGSSEGPPFMIYYASRRQTPPGLQQLINLVRAHEELSPIG